MIQFIFKTSNETKSKVVPLLNQVQNHEDILYLTKNHTMKMYGEVDVQLHIFLTLALDGGECSVSDLSHFTPVERDPQYPLDTRLGGPQSQSGHDGEEINSQLLHGIKQLSSSQQPSQHTK
jgi:hypothetical protein